MLGFRVFHNAVTGDDFVADAQISFEQLLLANSDKGKYHDLQVSSVRLHSFEFIVDVSWNTCIYTYDQFLISM